MARVGERGILGIRDDPKKRQSCGAQGSEFGGIDVSFTGVEIAEHDDAEFAREMIGGLPGTGAVHHPLKMKRHVESITRHRLVIWVRVGINWQHQSRTRKH